MLEQVARPVKGKAEEARAPKKVTSEFKKSGAVSLAFHLGLVLRSNGSDSPTDPLPRVDFFPFKGNKRKKVYTGKRGCGVNSAAVLGPIPDGKQLLRSVFRKT